VNADFKLSGNFMADVDAKHYVAKDLEASVKGHIDIKWARVFCSGD
jgi:hypothetical protein